MKSSPDAGLEEAQALFLARQVDQVTDGEHKVSTEQEDDYFLVVVTTRSAGTFTLRDDEDWRWLREPMMTGEGER